MNLRDEWSDQSTNEVLDRFYSKEETVDEVMQNFDIRRKYSAEGEELTINNVTDWCLVQTSSNPLKELDDIRKIQCPIYMDVQRGNYVIYENNVWLIDSNVVNVGNAYQSARMNRCSYLLKWQNSNGNIVERNVVSYNASAYNNGVLGNKIIELGSDQLMIFLPYDNETKCVKRGKRFFIDNNMEDPMVYRLTRPDRTTYVFNGVGCICWLVTECAYTATSADLEYGVCDYFSPTSTDHNNETTLLSVISGSKTLRAGFARTYSVTFADEDGVLLTDVDFEWNINCDFSDKITSIINDDKTIRLQVNDEGLIGSSFLLEVLVDDSVIDNLNIVIDHIY